MPPGQLALHEPSFVDSPWAQEAPILDGWQAPDAVPKAGPREAPTQPPEALLPLLRSVFGPRTCPSKERRCHVPHHLRIQRHKWYVRLPRVRQHKDHAVAGQSPQRFRHPRKSA
eukprot:Skav202013  [mRNA]  locus=scaffold1138:8648:13948:- [translate_table: standard]